MLDHDRLGLVDHGSGSMIIQPLSWPNVLFIINSYARACVRVRACTFANASLRPDVVAGRPPSATLDTALSCSRTRASRALDRRRDVRHAFLLAHLDA